MRKSIILLVVFLLVLFAPLAVRYFQYYRPFTAARAAPPDYSAEGIAAVPTPDTSDFQDDPELSRSAASGAGGLVALDQAHDNQFSLEEIATLDSLLASRGFTLAPFSEGELDEVLRPAGALVVIAPVLGYSSEEVLAVRDFVARGGRVLLIGDPTRYNIEFDEDNIFAPPAIRTAQVPLNDIANAFDITYRGDYLYNTTANEGNFRNILLEKSGFASGALTDGLDRLAFYSSHSLQLGPKAAPLLAADENTWSSATDRPGNLTLAAVSPSGEGEGGRVMALGDVHFLTEPYNAVYDNGEFASRVADFLVDNGRSAEGLVSFPYFFRAPVDLVYSDGPELGPDAFDDIVALQTAFRGLGLPLALTAEPDPDRDVLHLGIYNGADDVADLLERAGVELIIRPAIQPPSEDGEENGTAESGQAATRIIETTLGHIQMSGSALILLDTDGGRQQLVVLAASNDGLESAIHRLRAVAQMEGVDLSGCLLQDNLAICPTEIENEPVEYELVTSGPGEVDESPTESEDDAGDRADDGDGEATTANTADQGPIATGETQAGEIAAEEAHIWTFNGGPAVIDIVVDSADDLDAIVELYDPNNELLANVDSTFVGGVEEMRGVEIPDDGDYIILIRDYFNDGGNYELSVTEGEANDGGEASAPGNRVFIFADDDGQPLGEGVTSAPVFTDLLSADYDVTTWAASTDGPLPENLAEYDLLIWDSGTYRDEDGLFGEDTGTIIDYLDAGGDIFITGSSPTILGPVELAPLENLAVVAADPILSDGFEEGETIALDGVYEAALSEITDAGANEYIFLVRAPGEEGEGGVVGVAGIEQDSDDQKTLFLFAPFSGLPADVRAPLLNNIMAWFAA